MASLMQLPDLQQFIILQGPSLQNTLQVPRTSPYDALYLTGQPGF